MHKSLGLLVVLSIISVGILFLLVFGPSPLAASDLVPVAGDRFILDLRYHSTNNFLGKDVYRAFKLNQCWVRPEVAVRLKKVQKSLREMQLKLVLFDCFRPLAVQKVMWRLVPDPKFVADPKKGSNHNRGVAMDVTLADEQGRYLPMPTGFDDFTAKAAANYRCSSEEKSACDNRDRLIQLMSQAGFEVFPSEWWHFQLPDPTSYPLIKSF